jgi:long-subunit fatty acid transport protein
VKDARHEAFVARPRQGAGSGHDTLTYEVVGLVVKLFDQHLSLGLHALIPNGGFTHMRAFFNDEREQYFSNSLHPELYSDRMTAVTLALGAGIAITKRFSLGIGATLGLKANVVAPTYVVDAGRLGDILIDMDASVNIGFAPHFGVSYKLADRVRLSATAHTPQRVELGTAFTFLLTNGVEQASGVTFVLDYTPWQVGLGGSFDLIQADQHTLTLATTLLYASWSEYIDRHGEAPAANYAWVDTLSGTLGVRYRWHDLNALLDASYTPTPVPPQTGRTNYVDNDRISGSMGAQYRFNALNTDFWIGGQVQLHYLLERHQSKLPTPTRPDGANLAPDLVKDELPDDAQISGEPVASAEGLQTNNPGWPGYASGGWILGATVTFTVAL